jgi:hypothetical protein
MRTPLGRFINERGFKLYSMAILDEARSDAKKVLRDILSTCPTSTAPAG